MYKHKNSLYNSQKTKDDSTIRTQAWDKWPKFEIPINIHENFTSCTIPCKIPRNFFHFYSEPHAITADIASLTGLVPVCGTGTSETSCHQSQRRLIFAHRFLTTAVLQRVSPGVCLSPLKFEQITQHTLPLRMMFIIAWRWDGSCSPLRSIRLKLIHKPVNASPQTTSPKHGSVLYPGRLLPGSSLHCGNVKGHWGGDVGANLPESW